MILESYNKIHHFIDRDMNATHLLRVQVTITVAKRPAKHDFARLQWSTLALVLIKFQQILDSSEGCDKWLAAFVAVVGIAMALENQQKIVHQVMVTHAIDEQQNTLRSKPRTGLAFVANVRLSKTKGRECIRRVRK